jgi:hypothetical protein
MRVRNTLASCLACPPPPGVDSARSLKALRTREETPGRFSALESADSISSRQFVMTAVTEKQRTTSLAQRSPPINEGQRLLRKAARQSSLAAVARAVGCKSRENCRCWLQGTKTPNRGSRSKLERAFGIPPSAWEQLPSDHPARLAETQHVQDVAVELNRASTGSALDDCLALLADLRSYRQQPGLLLKHRLRYTDCETRILALRARLERDVELSEDRYVHEHPAWRRLQETILSVLRAYPEAMQAMLVALERNQASAGDRDGSAHGLPIANADHRQQIDCSSEVSEPTRA